MPTEQTEAERLAQALDQAALWFARGQICGLTPSISELRNAAALLRTQAAEIARIEKDARRYSLLIERLPAGVFNDAEVSDAASWAAAIDALTTQDNA